MKNKLKTPFINDMITYLMVIAAYVIVEVLLKAGHVSSLMKGLLVPLCTYSILAVSLNLVVPDRHPGAASAGRLSCHRHPCIR